MTKSGMTKSVGIFSAVILLSAICAIKFSQLPVVWILGLTASIPIYAAISGAFLKSKE
jgi:short subunit fatty acids transporter